MQTELVAGSHSWTLGACLVREYRMSSLSFALSPRSCPPCGPWTSVRQAPLSMDFSRRGRQGGLPLSAPGHLPDQGSNLCLCGLLNWPVDAWPLAPLSTNEPIYRTGSEAQTDRQKQTRGRTEQEQTYRQNRKRRRDGQTERDAQMDRTDLLPSSRAIGERTGNLRWADGNCRIQGGERRRSHCIAPGAIFDVLW